MVSIGRHTDYASRIVLHLAGLEPGTRVTAAEIAARHLIPPVFIRRIVSRLSKAGIITTVRGAKGGITLARPAAELSMRDIVEAMEGPIALNPCVIDPQSCPLSDGCPVQRAWVSVNDGLMELLQGVKFDALAGQVEGRFRADSRTRHGGAKVRALPKGGTKA